MKRRILSSLMALVLVFGLLPATAFAEEDAAPAAAKTIYVDAVKGNDDNEKVGESWETAYKTLETAVTAADSGDTIQLGEGNYTLYKVSSEGHTKGKDLTFVGQGADKTGWNIGALVPDPANFGTEYNGDYSFDGAGTITFKNMTLRSGSANYLGFIRADNTVVDNCTINGKTFYWGYTSATFTNTTFNCPSGDYALWTYCSPVMTFNNCTFNSSGKVINVYNENKEADYTINFNNCTVNSSITGSLSVMNINDTLVKEFTINFTGTNKVTGIKADGIQSTDGSHASPAKDTGTKTSEQATCSKLFEFNMKYGNGNNGKTTVNIDGKTVWQGGKKVSHAIDTDNDKYTDGYKDNAFTTVEGEWTTNQDGIKTRTITKTCDYCGYQEKTTEIDWNVPKSKTATRLDKKTWTSDVTLSLFDGTATVVLPDMPGNQTHGVAYTVGAGSTVTDTIGEKFTFGGVDSFTLKVGAEEIKGVKDASDANTVNFGNQKDDGKYPYTVTYTPDTKTFVWTINEVLDGRESVQLTYTVQLTKPETAPGTYGVEDLKGEKVLTDTEAANALYTNASAVLNAKTENNVTIVEQEFPKPSVSYTVHSFVPVTTTYYFAVEKVDAQDDHALSGARFGLYLDGKQIAAATSDRSGLVLFCVSESDYRKISANSSLYYQELTAPEGYLVNGDAVSIGKDNLTTSRAVAEKNAVTVRNYRNTVPAMLNGSDHFAYVVGYEDGCVRPNGLISRAETSSIFFRLLKDSVRDSKLLTTNTYADVPSDHWANTAISTMTGLGIVQGYNSTTFEPSAPITRAQFAAICARFDTGKSSGTQTFTDIKGHWAEKYIERAAELGWIKGFEDGTFRPDTYITRAQAMTMINRVLNRIPEDASDLLPDMNVWPDCNPGDWFYLAVQEATNSHDFEHKAGNYETWTKLMKNPDWTRYEN